MGGINSCMRQTQTPIYQTYAEKRELRLMTSSMDERGKGEITESLLLIEERNEFIDLVCQLVLPSMDVKERVAIIEALERIAVERRREVTSEVFSSTNPEMNGHVRSSMIGDKERALLLEELFGIQPS